MGGVDYSVRGVAQRYSEGRALNDAVLARWGSAVMPFLPARAVVRVLDLAAGTGIFARAWPQWLRCEQVELVAVEPAAAMRSQLVDGGLPKGVRVVAARGEHIPLRAASVDVAWLSTVVHHLSDLDRCAAELRRVLDDDGVVLIRGLFADRGEPAGIDLLPGWRRAVSGFPSTTQLESTFSQHGFGSLACVDVEDSGPRTVGQAADRVRRLRSADSLLGRFTDEELAEGLNAMDHADPCQPLGPSTLALVALGVR